MGALALVYFVVAQCRAAARYAKNEATRMKKESERDQRAKKRGASAAAGSDAGLAPGASIVDVVHDFADRYFTRRQRGEPVDDATLTGGSRAHVVAHAQVQTVPWGRSS